MTHLKTFRRKNFKKEAIVIILIVLSPLITYVHLKFPEIKRLETSVFTIDSNYYEDIQLMVWTISIKLALVLTFALWFLTCKHWWRFSLLIPLIFYINQLMVVINDEIEYADNKELIYSIFVAVPLIILLLLISKKLNYYSKSKNLTEELDIEIKELFVNLSLVKQKDYKEINDEVIRLRAKKSIMNKKDYLSKLIALRDSIN